MANLLKQAHLHQNIRLDMMVSPEDIPVSLLVTVGDGPAELLCDIGDYLIFSHYGKYKQMWYLTG